MSNTEDEWCRDGDWCRYLTDDEKEWVNSVYQEIKSKAYQCGTDSPDPCWLLSTKHHLKYRKNNHKNKKKPQKIPGAPPKLPHYWLAFVRKHGQFPKTTDEERKSRSRRKRKKACELSHVCGNRKCIVWKHMVWELALWNKERYGCHGHIRRMEGKHRNDPNVDVSGKVTIADIRHLESKIYIPECTHEPKCFVNFENSRAKRKLRYRDEDSKKQYDAEIQRYKKARSDARRTRALAKRESLLEKESVDNDDSQSLRSIKS